MKHFLIIFVATIFTHTLLGQQEAAFTHYMHNTQAVNPGYVGTREALTVTALYRRQWVGFEGAPETQTVTIHTPLKNENLGVGFSLINDKIGPLQTQTVTADIAYKLRFGNGRYLSLGIKGGVDFRRNTVNRLFANDEGDASLAVDPRTSTFGNVGTGAYYYSDKFYVGASVTGLLRSNLGKLESGLAKQEIHGYFITGTYFDISESIEFKPTALVRVVPNAPIQVEMTATFILNEKFTAGGFYRGGDGAGLLAGVYVQPNMYLGYSYDYSISNITGESNQGTHEVIVTYDFVLKHNNIIRSPRYF